jgi:hypothetical protein
MLHVCTLFWQPNRASRDFSRCYDESWVEKLYRGFRRNLTVPFRFLAFVDRSYRFAEPDIEQMRLLDAEPSYASCIQPYRLGVPTILVGLDTVVVGNIDHMAEYCLSANRFALPRDPYHPNIACNGVALVPAGHQLIGTAHEGENDMEWVRRFPHRYLDQVFPGQVLSYKGHVEKRGLGDARIVYFHGLKKSHELGHVAWIREHWV